MYVILFRIKYISVAAQGQHPAHRGGHAECDQDVPRGPALPSYYIILYYILLYYVYIYIYIHTLMILLLLIIMIMIIYVYICIYIYIHIHTYTYIYIYIHTYISMLIRTFPEAARRRSERDKRGRH